MRRNLKEAVGKPLVRRKEITYKARLREMSRQRATKSNNQEAIRIITDIREIRKLEKKISVEIGILYDRWIYTECSCTRIFEREIIGR